MRHDLRITLWIDSPASATVQWLSRTFSGRSSFRWKWTVSVVHQSYSTPRRWRIAGAIWRRYRYGGKLRKLTLMGDKAIFFPKAFPNLWNHYGNGPFSNRRSNSARYEPIAPLVEPQIVPSSVVGCPGFEREDWVREVRNSIKQEPYHGNPKQTIEPYRTASIPRSACLR